MIDLFLIIFLLFYYIDNDKNNLLVFNIFQTQKILVFLVFFFDPRF